MTTEVQSRPLARAAISPVVAARALLARRWDGTLPVDPEAIAKAEGLTVERLGVFDEFPFSGEFIREKKLIRVSADEASVRQRFTLAHELGHYALGHPNAPRDSVEMFSARTQSPIERAANQFAAELLMPADAIAKVVRSGLFKTVDDLAIAFSVSKVAMTYRINNLGLLV